MDKFDASSVRQVLNAVWSDDRRGQKQAVQMYYTDDVHFEAEVADSWGKDSLYQGTRGLNFLLGLNGIYDVRDIIISNDGTKAVMWGSAAYTHGFGPLSYKYPVPLVVILYARQEADGKWRINKHIENHSFYLLYTAVLSEWGIRLFHSVFGPAFGMLLGGAGMVGDAVACARERAWDTVGQVLRDFF